MEMQALVWSSLRRGASNIPFSPLYVYHLYIEFAPTSTFYMLYVRRIEVMVSRCGFRQLN